MTFVIYGPEGVGKTTLAVSAPGCILADIEDGSSELACARYPFYPDDPDHGHVPRSYQDILDMIDDLTNNDHSFKALALDSLDRLESLMWRWLLNRDSAASAKNRDGELLKSIEDYGYGKGYTMAVEEWRSLCARLDRLRYVRGMEIIFIGHAQVKPFKNPTGEDYDRWQLRINEKAGGFLKEYAKVTAFMTLEEESKKLSKHGRPKGISTNMRLLKLARSAAVDAKSRLALPDEIEVDVADPWRPFAEAVEAAGQIVVGDIAKRIEEEFTRIADEDRAKRARPVVEKAVKENDAGKLQRFLMELRKIEVAS
jgi:RecA-family ATPase